MQRTFIFCVLLLSIVSISFPLSYAGGKVYLVLGSDTAIWEGMNTNRFHCTYPLSLYTDPARNAYKVMDPAWRNPLTDSYGTPMKLTWWMMAGNIFRYATNTNVPVPNIMTLYLMQKYHGEAIRQFGDELTLHYHTFSWTDYDGDGAFWWNQALEFSECREDFDYTLAQFLLEENVFPVSFRSGWHAMYNEWQAYLDQLLPYSMHNDYPAKRTDTVEPLDNSFDWSQSPPAWVPFRPSPEDYRLPGNGRGWNLRSKHIGSVDSSLMRKIFAAADSGTNQVACLWGHLPETDFLDNLEKIDSLAHLIARYFPNVAFHYCTAVEAMQLWRETADTTAPVVTIQENRSGDDITFTITTDEAIFQPQPFVAIKDRYERYQLVPCASTGTLEWTTTTPVDGRLIAKLGVAVTDTLGNHTKVFRNYLPDDLFVDDEEPGYEEVKGAWSTLSTPAWGKTARGATVAPGDTGIVRWNLAVADTGLFNIFVQVPIHAQAVTNLQFRLLQDNLAVDSVLRTTSLAGSSWHHLFTAALDSARQNAVEMIGVGSGSSNQILVADVVRCTPLVREKELALEPELVDYGEASLNDTVTAIVHIANRGIQDLHVSGVSTRNQWVFTPTQFPMVIPPMQSADLSVSFNPLSTGTVVDTLLIESDDPIRPWYPLPLAAAVLLPFRTADNEDAGSYSETGTWYYSVAQAYGPTSRYAPLAPGNWATFRLTAPLSGTYDILEIVPKTVNASDAALYVIRASGAIIDSVILNQNVGSGAWVRVGRYEFTAGTEVVVTVHNVGPTSSGKVLRADALKLQNVDPSSSFTSPDLAATPTEFELSQNYPNPFNPTTTITYSLPRESEISLVLYDNLGRAVMRLDEGRRQAGIHEVRVKAERLGSGVYYYRLIAGGFVQTRRMVLVR